MNTELKHEILRIMQNMIEQIWSRNFRLYDDYADDAITGIGPYEAEYVSTKAELKTELLKRSSNYPPLYLDGEKFEVISEDVSSCVIAGEYNLYAEGHLLKQHRITAVWSVKRKKPKMNHLQFTEVQRDLNGPQHEYTRALRRHKEEQSLVPVRDHTGKLFMLEPADIEWIDAARNYITIHRADDGTDLKVRAVFTDFINNLPSQFLTVSRGHAINMDYVDSFSRNIIRLIDGKTYKVSRSNQAEVAKKMDKIDRIFQDM